MEKTDFFKYLKHNNLYNVYNNSKEITNRFGLPYAVSMISQNIPIIPPRISAWDILEQNNDITINCNLTAEQMEYGFGIGYANGFEMNENQTNIHPIESLPEILKNNTHYFLLSYRWNLLKDNETYNSIFSFPYTTPSIILSDNNQEQIENNINTKDFFKYGSLQNVSAKCPEFKENERIAISLSNVYIHNENDFVLILDTLFGFDSIYKDIIEDIDLKTIYYIFGDTKKKRIYASCYYDHTVRTANDDILNYTAELKYLKISNTWKNTGQLTETIETKIQFMEMPENKNDPIYVWLKQITV